MIARAEVGKITVPGIAREVQYVFTTSHLHYVRPLILKVLSEEEWIQLLKRCWEEERLLKCSLKGSTYFLFFCQRNVNPLLNQRLNRPADYPTFNNMLAYAFREMISNTVYCRELIKEQPRDPNFKTFPAAYRCN